MNRLTIAQSLSPQLDPYHARFIPELKLFEMFNVETEKIYGKGSITFEMTFRDRKCIDFVGPTGVKVNKHYDICEGYIDTKESVCIRVPSTRMNMPPKLGVYTLRVDVNSFGGYVFGTLNWERQ